MPYSISLSVLVTSMCLSAQFVQTDIRDDFHHNDLDKERLSHMIENVQYENSALTLAYKGLCETMLAEYAFLPTSKLRAFNRGKEKVETAISQSPKNCELSYIRLLVQLNAPRFLGYYDNIEQDLDYFISNCNDQIAGKWRSIFVDNLLQGKFLSQKQKDQLLSLKKHPS